MPTQPSDRSPSAPTRLIICLVAGLIEGLVVALLGPWKFAPLTGWDTAALFYVVWTGLIVLPLNASNTASHAKQEDVGRAWTDVLLIGASVASLIAVASLIVQAGHSSGTDKVLDILIGLISVFVSWSAVHTTFALKYARLFYSDPGGGIDFNETRPPRYADFAYLAFTVGMTFQVADTNLKTREIRSTVLKHALLSYIFGTVIIATTINTVVSLSQ